MTTYVSSGVWAALSKLSRGLLMAARVRGEREKRAAKVREVPGWSVGGWRGKFYDLEKLKSDVQTTRDSSRIPSCSLCANVGGGNVPKRKTHSTSLVHRDS